MTHDYSKHPSWPRLRAMTREQLDAELLDRCRAKGTASVVVYMRTGPMKDDEIRNVLCMADDNDVLAYNPLETHAQWRARHPNHEKVVYDPERQFHE